MEPKSQPPDRRSHPRATRLTDHRAEFKFVGLPIYHLKVRDLSATGAGIVARADSTFLALIRVGQELNVRLIPQKGAAGLSGHYRSRIEHISELRETRFRGHKVVGLSIGSRTDSF